MKFILSFLSICVAVSHQQYRDQILMLRPWMSQFYHPSNTFNNFPPHIRQGIYGDSRVNPIFNNGNVKFPRVYLNFLINVIGNCFYYRMTKRIRWVSINTRPTDSSSPGSRTLKKNLRFIPISRIKWINVIFSIIIIGITL